MLAFFLDGIFMGSEWVVVGAWHSGGFFVACIKHHSHTLNHARTHVESVVVAAATCNNNLGNVNSTASWRKQVTAARGRLCAVKLNPAKNVCPMW